MDDPQGKHQTDSSSIFNYQQREAILNQNWNFEDDKDISSLRFVGNIGLIYVILVKQLDTQNPLLEARYHSS